MYHQHIVNRKNSRTLIVFHPQVFMMPYEEFSQERCERRTHSNTIDLIKYLTIKQTIGLRSSNAQRFNKFSSGKFKLSISLSDARNCKINRLFKGNIVNKLATSKEAINLLERSIVLISWTKGKVSEIE